MFFVSKKFKEKTKEEEALISFPIKYWIRYAKYERKTAPKRSENSREKG